MLIDRGAGKLLLWLTMLALLSSFAVAEQSQNITEQCKVGVTEGKTSALTDKKIATAWSPSEENAEIVVKLPEGGAGYVRLEWMFDPAGYEFLQYDASKEAICSRDETDSHPGISQVFALDSRALYFVLRLKQPGQEICSLRVFSKGDLPPDVPQWEAPYEKCDLMVVSTHQDDEFIFMGGVIPYYERAMGKRVQVVYMANCGRLRRAEALNGLWEAGTRHYPEFINLKDQRVGSMEEGVELWGGKEAVIGALVERIRRFQPEVILTHDLDGEYGHKQHKITAHAMRYAVEAAADPARYPESYAKYGAWQVKKIYLHLYGENVIDFDWNAALPELGGLTPLQVARNAYAKHESQQKYYQVEDGGRYDNSLFGLAYTVVGNDLEHRDLFENIPDDAPSAAAEPEGGAYEESEGGATEEMGEPHPSSDAPEAGEPSDVEAPPSGGGPARTLAILGGCLAVAAAGVFAARTGRRRRRGRGRGRHPR